MRLILHLVAGLENLSPALKRQVVVFMRTADPNNLKDWAALVGNLVHMVSHLRTNAGRVASGLKEQKKENAALEAENADLRSRLEETLAHVSRTAALCDSYDVPDTETLVRRLEDEITDLRDEIDRGIAYHQDTIADCRRLLDDNERQREKIKALKAAGVLSGISEDRVSKSSSRSKRVFAPPPPPKISRRPSDRTPRWIREDTDFSDFSETRRG
jgi:hypothetical protein